MTILPKVIYRSSVILISFLAELDKTIVKFIQNHQRPKITKTILSKQNKQTTKPYNVGGITVPNLNIYYRAIVVKTI